MLTQEETNATTQSRIPSGAKEAPVADWVTIPELYKDPFPIYERLRAEGGVHWVPAVGRYLITSYSAVSATEHDQETYSANEEGSLQIRAMGHSMLRKDDPEHYIERAAWQPTLKPGYVRRVWASMYRDLAEKQLEKLIEKGPGADLIWDFAAPFASESLRNMIGLYNATQEDLQRWSQTMIDATGNYADDPDVWAAGKRSFDEVDEALDEMLKYHAKNRDNSLISGLLSIPDYRMPIEQIRANIKMTIGGGLNEPRDALGVAAYALMTHPEQRADVMANQALWPTVFEETIRWVAPIGMYSRQVTRDTVLDGTFLPQGARLGICVLSANRDENVWDSPEKFNIHREAKPHLAFSKGVHVCLGSWAARSQIADVALPLLFNSLEGLDLHPDKPSEAGGWVFRGMLSLPVTWKSVAKTPGYGSSGTTAGSGNAAGPRVAIIGSGPSGSFAAKEILRKVDGSKIDVFDKLPVPYGLLRYGVAADHQGTKTVEAQFDKVYSNERVRFIGNTSIDLDEGLTQLRENYDAVVLATGAADDRVLALPGTDLNHVYTAGRVTRLLNGHPDEFKTTEAGAILPELGSTVAVVGQGNVAIDLLRLLGKSTEELHGSDIRDEIHGHLRTGIQRIHVIGRSPAHQAKFDPVMVRELARVPGMTHILHGVDLAATPEGKDARIDSLRDLMEGNAAFASGGQPIEVHWHFGATPQAFEGTDAVQAVQIQDHTGESGSLDVDSVVTAVGFENREYGSHGLQHLPAAIPADGQLAQDMYAIGWVRNKGRGTIPDQRVAAQELATKIASEVSAGRISTGAAGIESDQEAVDFRAWKRIDLKEKMTARAGRCREKIVDWDALLETARDESLDTAESSVHSEADAELAVDQPISILYGTESGNAELVAEELAEFLSAQPDLEVKNLSEITPGELSTDRFYMVICSTYGDGEVPTSALAFYEQLVRDGADLSGVRFAVFGLGDASYAKTYSRGSELVAEAMEKNGASRLGEYGRHDAGGLIPADEAACEWAEGILSTVGAADKEFAA
ncbi:cytochrome P450 [Pseudoglutamicibacter cumminsii]|uniref:Cytochrome P450 n=1 Tax=Pseudoglutamicibacter cumminsii TaxID=156979 RepID=A0AAP4FGA1_9MICC|nr:cytochrome P450 [Pseudoglutamicibacter cumminsii]MDK6274677.1 cytochrome P450 [Pseudoglutamicibacter cumminsii]